VAVLPRRVESSPQLYARTGGALYLIIIVAGVFGESFVRGRLIVPGDASVTAGNITAMESLWRFGIAAEFVALVCAVALAMILFVLLRPVSRELNLLATFFRLASLTIEAVAALNLLEALSLLRNATSLEAFTAQQLNVLVAAAIRSHGDGFGVALLFLGVSSLIHGYLILKSGFLPKTVGGLFQVAGICYLTNSTALVLAPGVANQIFPAILLPAFVGELSLCLWLLVKGVNVDGWRQVIGVSGVAPARFATARGVR